jgi:hypothetical protein
MSLTGGIRCRRSLRGSGAHSTDQGPVRVGSATTSVANRPRTTWVPSTESPGSNMNAPGIAGSERSRVMYTRIASSSARRFTPGILPFSEPARKEPKDAASEGAEGGKT